MTALAQHVPSFYSSNKTYLEREPIARATCRILVLVVDGYIQSARKYLHKTSTSYTTLPAVSLDLVAKYLY